MEKDKLIKKWLIGDLTEAEREAFMKREDYKEHLRIVESAKYFKASKFSETQDIESFYRYYKDKRSLSIKKRKSLVPVLLKVAAVVVVLFGIGYMFLNPSIDAVNTDLAEKIEVTLPDNSEVIVNADSQVSYDSDDWNNKRSVSLKGEAFFKVAKGKKFDVITSNGKVTVLGTQFNVKSRAGFFEVHCYEGLVSLSMPDEGEINIAAGSRFRIVDGQRYFDKTLETKPSWINNLSTLKSVPYLQVIKEFERQYDVQITLVAVNQNQLFTGGFVHNSLQDGLKSITLPLDLTYSVDKDNNITITNKE